MSVKRMILFAALAGAIAGLAFVAFQWNRSGLPTREQGVLVPGVVPIASAAPESTSSSIPSVRHEARSGGDAEKDDRWSAFRTKFGRQLRGEFLQDGRLVVAQGALGAGEKAGADFNPSDPQKIAARAREILAASQALLGLKPELPLDGPRAVPGPASAQAVFRETYDGVAVAPLGAVTMDFGPQGELIAMESTYMPNLQVGNSVQIGEIQARERAAASVNDSIESGLKVEGGSRVIWITEPAPEGKPSSGRHAYEYSVKGRQVIVDAGDGSIIVRRDRRHF